MGDLGVFDEQGFSSVVGHFKDVVIRGGENICPPEIEDYFFRHPKVSKAQMFGISDQKYGEELARFVV